MPSPCPSRRAPRAALVALTAAVVLGAAACSSGGGDDSASEARDTTTSAEASTTTRASCPPAASSVRPGQEKVTLRVAGADRWYLRHVPPGYDGTRPTPVVVDIHGYSEGAELHTILSGLGPFGDTHGFVTITPQGSGAVPWWNVAPGSDDVRFFGALLDDVERTLCVDTARVYATGMSNGALMSSRLACTYADRIAAAAPVAGVTDPVGCRPSRPVPVVAFHGTADPYLPYTGGLGTKALDLPLPDGSGRKVRDVLPEAADVPPFPSVPDSMKAWAGRNGCTTAAPSERTIAADVTLVAFDCPTGADVELYRVEGGGHSWPGSAFLRAVAKLVGPTTASISADDVMWAFFEAHPRAG